MRDGEFACACVKKRGRKVKMNENGKRNGIFEREKREREWENGRRKVKICENVGARVCFGCVCECVCDFAFAFAFVEYPHIECISM